MAQVRTRFSPSPTGSLHLGGAHTALFNWLFARHHRGVFLLRIEDTDKERSEERFTAEILESLTWLGLGWDGEIFRQSERLSIYHDYIERLLQAGAAYACDCEPADLEARRQAALAQGKKPRYNGACRDKGLKQGPNTAVRFKTPHTGVTHWQDLIKGPIAFENQELDDLVLLRADGIPTYNFAVVVDDLTMEVTHIIRGDDHIPNTPRQLLIYAALNAAPPLFAHMPLMLGQDRSKLSKRHGALPILTYRERGFLAHTLINYLARLGWSHGDQEIFSLEELIRFFSLKQVGKAAGIFDEEKLLWLNGHYLKETPAPALAQTLVPYLAPLGIPDPDPVYLAKVVTTLRARSKTLVEMADAARFYFHDPRPYDPQAAAKFLYPENAPLLTEIAGRIQALPDLEEASITQMLQDLAAATNRKMVNVAQPLRVALTGKTISPGLTEIIPILGKEEVLKRINQALNFMKK